jgi:hypothetical protein
MNPQVWSTGIDIRPAKPSATKNVNDRIFTSLGTELGIPDIF